MVARAEDDQEAQMMSLMQCVEQDRRSGISHVQFPAWRYLKIAGLASTLAALVIFLSPKHPATAAWMQPAEAVSLVAALQCTAGDGNCFDTKCCQHPGMKCFQKNEWWAACNTTCTPGKHAADKDGKPWSCNILSKAPKPKFKSRAEYIAFLQGLGPDITCDGGPLPSLPASTPTDRPPAIIRALTYNLFWWRLYGVEHGNGESASHLIAQTNQVHAYDLMGFQECESGSRVLNAAGIGQHYTLLAMEEAALCMAYRTSVFDLLSSGQDWVAEDKLGQQYYGKRAVQWSRLTHRISQHTVLFMNHHGPLVVNSGGKCGGEVTAVHLLRVVAARAKPGDTIILLGDFNAAPGSATLRTLAQRLNDNFPHGFDNIFTNLPGAALVDKVDIGSGGSDHQALSVRLRLGYAGVEEPHIAPHSPSTQPPKRPPTPASAKHSHATGVPAHSGMPLPSKDSKPKVASTTQHTPFMAHPPVLGTPHVQSALPATTPSHPPAPGTQNPHPPSAGPHAHPPSSGPTALPVPPAATPKSHSVHPGTPRPQSGALEHLTWASVGHPELSNLTWDAASESFVRLYHKSSNATKFDH